MISQARATLPEDFREIISVQNERGQLALVVGGHAANLWAGYYQAREPELESLGPFVSKDLDFLGDQRTVWQLAERLGTPPKRPGRGEASPMVAWFDFQTKSDIATRVEVLFSVYGLAPAELEAGAAVIQSPQIGSQVRLPNTLTCLKMKTHNAVGLDQARRQDVKHVKMLILCNRGFLRDVLADCEAGKVSERTFIKAVEALFVFVRSEIASSGARKFGFDWTKAFPIQELLNSPLPRVQNFVDHRLRPAFSL